MSSMIRSTRSSLRRKMVLPVTVIRQNGQEKQLAHTLDLTAVSARLGGLCSLLQPGEVIEVQRDTLKAKFQVFWMGAAGSAMEGQAGVRGLEPDKNIWGINLPVDETDTTRSPELLRKDSFHTRIEGRPVTERRWYTRLECTGGATVHAEGLGFPILGQVKDISQGGVYVETLTQVKVNTEVYIRMNVEGIEVESPGVVRTSYPLVGIGISFQNLSPHNQEKIFTILQSIRNRAAASKNMTGPALASGNSDSGPAELQLDAYPVRVLATAFRTLAANFDNLKIARSPAELDELRLALSELETKLSPPPQIELVDFYSASSAHSG
ncbi:MAG TPA: PilZ domain-containing protein [Candidatus Angelobacter sp.]